MEKEDYKRIIDNLPIKYKIALLKSISFAYSSFKENLQSITLGGSGGKGNIIEGWSDLDLYFILYEYNQDKVLNFMKNINNLDIHIGTTFYTLDEIKYNLIDCKTKVMCYEKQNYKVNPTLYGEDIFNTITYDEIVESDIRNLPNILHDFRRKYIDLKSDDDKQINKPYIKKMLVLIKCILNSYGIFSYGYNATVNKIKELAIEEGYELTPIIDFDIMNLIKNMDDSKEEALEFSSYLLKIIENIYKKKGEKKLWKKELVQGQ